jgi:hypothetical protein
MGGGASGVAWVLTGEFRCVKVGVAAVTVSDRTGRRSNPLVNTPRLPC